MRIQVNDETKDYRSVWMEDDIVKMINQPLIPHKFEIYECRYYPHVAEAIKTMIIRGAPAIGAAGCYGMALAALQDKELEKAAEVLRATRPTAYDLFDAIDYFEKRFKEGGDPIEIANAYADESAERCRKIGETGEKLINDGARILTHCNAGALACVDYGTALAPIRLAHYNGKKVFVFVDETRPRCQGARLTAWEMVQEGIDHAVIADNAAGYYMKEGEVDIVIAGTDRVAKNGDVANKIGTYEKAVLAKENGIPFYIAAPISTFDLSCSSGDEIPIEERDEGEVHYIWGLDESGEISKIRITPNGAKARNPSFDVTPAGYIKGFITEFGLIKPNEVKSIKD